MYQGCCGPYRHSYTHGSQMTFFMPAQKRCNGDGSGLPPECVCGPLMWISAEVWRNARGRHAAHTHTGQAHARNTDEHHATKRTASMERRGFGASLLTPSHTCCCGEHPVPQIVYVNRSTQWRNCVDSEHWSQKSGRWLTKHHVSACTFRPANAQGILCNKKFVKQ